MGFRLPGGADRTVVIGGTGTGKTVFGAWVLSRQRWDVRPWVAIDFKDEVLWDEVGSPPMKELSLGELPGKTGFFRLRVNPGQDEALEKWLWRIWGRGNVGLFCDEFSFIGGFNSTKALLRQGRSRLTPMISCTQRPADCGREVFTEASFVSVFRLDDIRDAKIIQGFTRNAAIDAPLPTHWSHWYDKSQGILTTIKPCPNPSVIVSDLKEKVPYSWVWG